MLFNSLEFAIFLAVVWTLYWIVPASRLRAQNLLVLAASYLFYGWWDWRFLALIAISSAADFSVGKALGYATRPAHRRFLLLTSLVVNLGLLGFFKYFNFFADSLAAALAPLGIELGHVSLNIVLPVGISFYTFQTLSYTIDVYRRRLAPTKDAVAFFAFVSFFPQLVAGPIERAANLLPQFERPRSFDDVAAGHGLRLILWGLFKKIVVADNCGILVDTAFASPATFNSAELWVAAFLFAVQIYGDFSGYSDIARGVAALFGFRLMVNFAMPYFATTIGDFWRRWHISLSTWFRDYLFIPLGGSRVDAWRAARNVLVTFVVSGLWHGANWTFVVWGFLHGTWYLAEQAWQGYRVPAEVRMRRGPNALSTFVAGLTTFTFVLLAWVVFRAASLEHASDYLVRMFDMQDMGMPTRGTFALTIAGGFLTVEWLRRHARHVLDLRSWPVSTRWGAYAGVALWVLAEAGSPRTFIYFQF